MFRLHSGHFVANILGKEITVAYEVLGSIIDGVCHRSSWAVATVHTQEMVSARNAIDAHAQDLAANDKLLLPNSWKHSYIALARYTVLEMLDLFSQYVASTNSGLVVLLIANSAPHRTSYKRTPLPVSCGLWSVSWAKLLYSIALWTYIA